MSFIYYLMNKYKLNKSTSSIIKKLMSSYDTFARKLLIIMYLLLKLIIQFL